MYFENIFFCIVLFNFMMLEWVYNYFNILYDILILLKVIDCDNIYLGFFFVYIMLVNLYICILNYINKI